MALVELIADFRGRGSQLCISDPRDALRFHEAADLLASYHSLAQAAGYSEIGEALKAIPMMKAVIARANNTLFGSWGFFMSKSGDDEPTEHHLSDEIDKLKEYGRKQYQRAEALATPSPPITDEED